VNTALRSIIGRYGEAIRAARSGSAER